MLVLGIDNGFTGGLCLYGGASGDIIDMIPMPVRIIDQIVDETAMLPLLSPLKSTDRVCIERPRGSKSAAALKSMHRCHASLMTILARECPCPVHCITAKTWQREMIEGQPGDNNKKKAYELARFFYPEHDFRPKSGPGSKSFHSGMVDAALIAHWSYHFE